MNNNIDFEPVKEILKAAKTVLILLPQQLSIDKVASALSLALALKKMELAVTVGCPAPMTVVFNRLFGVNQITNKIGNRNLVVSFDYIKEAIEKVSYNIEAGKFNLVVEPKTGQPPLDSEKVGYSYTGADADAIFVCGAVSLDDLGNFATEEKDLFEQASIVSLAVQPASQPFAKINLVDPNASSVSELMVKLFQALELPIDGDMASNLLAGIEAATQKLTSTQTTGETLRLAAWLLDKQAKRNLLAAPMIRPGTVPFAPVARPAPSQMAPVIQSAQPIQAQPIQSAPAPQPTPDWYQPKIYKGNTQA
ncbi:hypothetical protein KKD62_01755 [Patescibacteria group bacterium]|nr:hypothetical protein [Patescibacteria group bacterium]MBU1931075.1 hypothetical protein [Patescibacteria group bacterium]